MRPLITHPLENHMAKARLIHFLCLCLCVMGCKKEEASPAPQEIEAQPDDFVYTWPSVEPRSLDPAQAMDSAALKVLYNTYEGLFIPGLGTGPVRLGLAKEAPQVSENGLLWRIPLREDGKWSDGTTVTARHFVAAWQRVVNPDTASPMAEVLLPLKNAKRIVAGEKAPSTLGVRAESEFVLAIQLECPTPHLKEILAHAATFPLRRDHIAKHGKEWTQAENWLSNGVYTVTEWKVRDHIQLKVNPHHRLAAKVSIQESRLQHVEDANTAWRLYEAGKLHRADPLPTEKLTAMLASQDPELHIDKTYCSTGMVFNVEKPPFDSPLVRKAVARALDKKRLTKHILRRGDTPANTYFPSRSAYEPPPGTPFDPEEAATLLAEAGFPNGSGFPKVSYLLNNYGANAQIAEFIQEGLKVNLGIEITLENVEWKTFLERVNAGDFHMARSNFCGIDDPLEWAKLFTTDHPVNWSRYRSAQFDAPIATAECALSEEVRMKTAQKAEEVILNEQLIAPLYFPVRAYALKSKIGGHSAHPNDIHLLQDLSIE